MTVVELIISKLRSRKQATERTAFGYYIEAVHKLASGSEIDADECSHILDVNGKDESDLERDVNIQQQRFSWAAQLQANRQAVADRIQAERDLQTAQQALQAAHDKLMPAINAAHDSLNNANLRFLTTQGADSRLAENILDQELLQREAALIPELQKIDAELRPLVADRGFKMDSLQNAEFRLAQMHSRKPGDWPGFGSVNPFYWKNKAIDPEQQNADDLQNQLRQLNGAIAARQQEQQRLQAELAEIHQQKLQP